jgi:hypothetical protein
MPDSVAVAALLHRLQPPSSAASPSEDSCGLWWSLCDEIFRATDEHVDDGRWRRTGFVFARLARGAETANPGAPILRRRSGSRRRGAIRRRVRRHRP